MTRPPYAKPAHPNGNTWADTLREERIARGWTQSQVSRMCNTDRCAVVNWERGVNFKPIQKWRRWADVLGYEIVLRKRGEP